MVLELILCFMEIWILFLMLYRVFFVWNTNKSKKDLDGELVIDVGFNCWCYSIIRLKNNLFRGFLWMRTKNFRNYLERFFVTVGLPQSVVSFSTSETFQLFCRLLGRRKDWTNLQRNLNYYTRACEENKKYSRNEIECILQGFLILINRQY